MGGTTTETGGRSFACSLTKALLLLKPSFRKIQREPWLKRLWAAHGIPDTCSADELAFGDFVFQYPAAMDRVQRKLGICLLVVRPAQRKGSLQKTLYKLLYDGRYALSSGGADQDPLPLRCLLLGRDNRVRLHADSPRGFPLLHENCLRRQMFQARQPLWQLLGCQPDSLAAAAPSPGNLAELENYIARFKPPRMHLTVQFATGHKKKSPVMDWLVSKSSSESADCILRLQAFSSLDYTLAYAAEWDPEHERAQKRGKKIEQDYARFTDLWKQLKVQEKVDAQTDASQANCAAAVNVARTGLNLAYDLGLVSAEELAHYSAGLGRTQSSVYCFVDEKHHLRFVTYYDESKTFCKEVPCFENDCSDFDREGMTPHERNLNLRYRTQAAQTMVSFWQDVWERRAYWIGERQTLLRPLVDRLEQLLARVGLVGESGGGGGGEDNKKDKKKKTASPLSRCLAQLNKLIHHQRVYLFTSQDSHLHSMKFYLTHFAYRTLKRCRGISIKAQSDDALVKLSIPGMTVWNLYTYFCCKSDVDFFAALAHPWVGPLPSEVVIAHANKSLTKQKIKTGDNSTVNALTYCRQHGWLFARHILRYWCNFGQFLLDTFGFEIHGQTTPPSASFLGFQCVWTQYVKKAGPLAQSLERVKPYYEDLMRERSRGGFMFSIQDALQQGGPLKKESGSTTTTTTASSIAEYDLVSAYGYGASKCLVPSGFCVGYGKKPPRSSRKLQQQAGGTPRSRSTSSSSSSKPRPAEGAPLERLDARARHRSFEFRAVYKIIHRLVHRQNLAVRSVYHNYAPLGIFTLGSKYNLDLAIVAEDGRLFLFQMDGNWAHSCHQCPPSSAQERFIQGQSHQEVRAKTEQRDVDIRAWVDAVNAGSESSGGRSDLVTYTLIHDCHSPGYSSGSLKFAFLTEPRLASLVAGYEVTDRCGKTLTPAQFCQLNRDRVSDDRFTFIALARVRVDKDGGNTTTNHQDNDHGSFSAGPLILYPREMEEEAAAASSACPTDLDDDDYYTLDRRSKRNFGRQALAWEGTVILTRDYYQFLEQTFGDRFHLDHLEWVLFYRTEPTINAIYQHLVNLRSTTRDPVLVTFIKRMVNLSAGFYGAHSSQLYNKTTYRLVNGPPKNYAFFRHSLSTQHTVDLEEASYHLLETKPWPKLASGGRQPSRSALPLFVTIVEYGKLRLVEILHFLRQHLRPGSFRICYSNVDNLILALGQGADCLEEAVIPALAESFRVQKPLFFVPEATATEAAVKTPGLAEVKWQRRTDSGWKFISLRTQHYCLSTESDQQPNLHKSSGWSNVSSEQAFDWAQQLLAGESVAVPQKRRVHKMLSMETRDVVFHF